MRCVQPEGQRGSLKWIQRAVARRSPDLEQPILDALPNAKTIKWRSPLPEHDFAEYRDSAFLEVLDLQQFIPALETFWPKRGPQWDALAVTDAGQVLLIEAKAHIAEFCSPPSQASPKSLALIQRAMRQLAVDLGLPEKDAEFWHKRFFQYTNRLAHLSWLRRQGVDAWLVLVGFTEDDDMPGITTAEAWEAAYVVADYALGIPSRHPLRRHIVHVHPSVTTLS
jgi:hypothetical protein